MYFIGLYVWLIDCVDIECELINLSMDRGQAITGINSFSPCHFRPWSDGDFQFLEHLRDLRSVHLLRVFLLKPFNCIFFQSVVPVPVSAIFPHGCHDNSRQEEGQEQGGLHGDVTLWIQTLLPAAVECLNREQVLSSM